jgi:plastocyanin
MRFISCSMASMLATAIAGIAPASAATHIVNVGGDTPPTFAPQSINVVVGDVVTFVNQGGNHNVVADDGSFRCSHGCRGDAQGDTGAPSTEHWVVSLTFNVVGTVGYFCEIHGAPGTGMFGTIVVQETTPVRLQSFDVE